MEPLELVVDVFATRRLVRLVVEDDITWGLRFKASGVHERLGYLVTCQSCTSVWAAVLVKTLPRWIRYGLAVSEGSIIMSSLLNEIGRE